MFDPTIHARTIARYLQAGDFVKDPTLFDAVTLQSVIQQGVALGQNGLGPVALMKSKLRGKDVFQIDGLSTVASGSRLTVESDYGFPADCGRASQLGCAAV